mmetsp:Transcript_7306/g.21585  ORF Transcript_7306/g.21585 Transcript_7306/m.21585 type:complete len:213 (-) Transcript_7306:121-759(-)
MSRWERTSLRESYRASPRCRTNRSFDTPAKSAVNGAPNRKRTPRTRRGRRATKRSSSRKVTRRIRVLRCRNGRTIRKKRRTSFRTRRIRQRPSRLAAALLGTRTSPKWTTSGTVKMGGRPKMIRWKTAENGRSPRKRRAGRWKTMTKIKMLRLSRPQRELSRRRMMKHRKKKVLLASLEWMSLRTRFPRQNKEKQLLTASSTRNATPFAAVF